MNARLALAVLIEAVDLDPAQKETLIDGLPEMSDADVMELGSALAQYRRAQAAQARATLAAIDAALEQGNQMD